jgi:hypothetical protein
MDPIVEVAIIVAASTVSTACVPIVIDRIRASDRRKERKEDQGRLAEVASRAKDATVTAQRTLEIATTTHALVNSDFTKVKQALLTALEMAADLMRGGVPNAHNLADTLQQIDELRAELNKRALIQEDINKGY